MDYTKQSIPRPVDQNKRKIFYYSAKRKGILLSKINFGLTTRFHFHKDGHKKQSREDCDMYKKNYDIIPKDVEKKVDLEYLGQKRIFLQNNYHRISVKEEEIPRVFKRRKRNGKNHSKDNSEIAYHPV